MFGENSPHRGVLVLALASTAGCGGGRSEATGVADSGIETSALTGAGIGSGWEGSAPDSRADTGAAEAADAGETGAPNDSDGSSICCAGSEDDAGTGTYQLDCLCAPSSGVFCPTYDEVLVLCPVWCAAPKGNICDFYVNRFDDCDVVAVSFGGIDGDTYTWYYKASTKALIGLTLEPYWRSPDALCSPNHTRILAGSFPTCSSSLPQDLCAVDGGSDAGDGGR
jgi:hypothetical protein